MIRTGKILSHLLITVYLKCHSFCETFPIDEYGSFKNWMMLKRVKTKHYRSVSNVVPFQTLQGNNNYHNCPIVQAIGEIINNLKRLVMLQIWFGLCNRNVLRYRNVTFVRETNGLSDLINYMVFLAFGPFFNLHLALIQPSHIKFNASYN